MKKTNIEIHCDSCHKDISPHETGYPAVYILQVSAINIALKDSSYVSYAVMIYPPISGDLYFCNIKCMKEYGDQK